MTAATTWCAGKVSRFGKANLTDSALRGGALTQKAAKKVSSRVQHAGPYVIAVRCSLLTKDGFRGGATNTDELRLSGR